MHSCEIWIPPHDGTTDDLLCLSAAFLDCRNAVIFSDHRLIVAVQSHNAMPLPALDVLLLCADPFVGEWPGVNGKGFLLIHAAVK